MPESGWQTRLGVTCYSIDLYLSMINKMTARMQSKTKKIYPGQCNTGKMNKPNAHKAIKTSGILGPSAIHSRIATPQNAISATNPINFSLRVGGVWIV